MLPKCSLSHHNNGTQAGCSAFIADCPEKAEKIIEKWNKEHPQKTIRDDFFEKFPDAPNKDGIPYACVASLYNSIKCTSHDGCANCWSRHLEEINA